MKDPVFEAFLASQYEAGMTLAGRSDRLELIPLAGDPPYQYIAEYRCLGLAKAPSGRILEQELWAVGITFPEDYLRRPVDIPQVLTYLGAAREPWHPNIRNPFVCLHVDTGMPLIEILHGLYDLITWNLYATSDEGLNHAASQWARRQDPGRFPIDRRPLIRPSRASSIPPAQLTDASP